MGRKTRIDWADASWNPVTGCLHGCEYCYARLIAKRFGCKDPGDEEDPVVLEEPYLSEDGVTNPYPYVFRPTFHKYRLTIPQEWKKQRNVFVCSMADLFGEWVPDDWIDHVMTACLAAPQHRYMFLTKNPERYLELAEKGVLVERDNFWYGSTVTRVDEPFFSSNRFHTFASIEPILEPFDWKPGMGHSDLPEWIIAGAETGKRKDRAVPEKDWMDGIIHGCAEHHIPLFMKESLRELMGADFVQEFPW